MVYDPLKDFPELLEHARQLVSACASQGMSVGRITIGGRMYPSFVFNTGAGSVYVEFSDYEKAIERQKELAQLESIQHRCDREDCAFCHLRRVLER